MMSFPCPICNSVKGRSSAISPQAGGVTSLCLFTCSLWAYSEARSAIKKNLSGAEERDEWQRGNERPLSLHASPKFTGVPSDFGTRSALRSGNRDVADAGQAVWIFKKGCRLVTVDIRVKYVSKVMFPWPTRTSSPHEQLRQKKKRHPMFMKSWLNEVTRAVYWLTGITCWGT